jgi:hypothetical protein
VAVKTKYYCDRCKCETNVGQLYSFVNSVNRNMDFEVCVGCYSDFRDWMVEPHPKNDPKPVKTKGAFWLFHQ